MTLGHHLMAYYEMVAARPRRASPTRGGGSTNARSARAALAGTGFPIDREATAAALGFDRPTANSLDAVSDRDFALDYLMAAVQCALHLSRLAEELIVWASQPFGFVALPDAFSTGSSIMPQKRNPDAAELVRGHAGRIAGAMVALVVTMKGLPLAYSKDMQDDKPPVFEAHDLLMLSLAGDGRDGRDDRSSAPNGCARPPRPGFSTATDLADWLVRAAGVPFREAHHITGRAVKLAEEKGCGLAELGLDDAAARSTRGSTSGVYDVLTVDASVRQPDQLRRHRARAGARADREGAQNAGALILASCCRLFQPAGQHQQGDGCGPGGEQGHEQDEPRDVEPEQPARYSHDDHEPRRDARQADEARPGRAADERRRPAEHRAAHRHRADRSECLVQGPAQPQRRDRRRRVRRVQVRIRGAEPGLREAVDGAGRHHRAAADADQDQSAGGERPVDAERSGEAVIAEQLDCEEREQGAMYSLDNTGVESQLAHRVRRRMGAPGRMMRGEKQGEQGASEQQAAIDPDVVRLR